MIPRSLSRLCLGVPLLFSACSPAYVCKSAAGHAKLLWRRQSIEKALADPRTPSPLREKLRLVRDVRSFAFERIHLRRSGDYGSYSPVAGPYLAYLVSACEKTRFKPYVWRFPLAGSFPYEGHFDGSDASREMRRLEKLGLDSTVDGVSAYNIPLPFSNPVPSTALDEPPGELAALIIHELAHGTIFFKNQVGFDESLATFVGNQGADDFLRDRYGEDSSELADFRRSLRRERAFSEAIEKLYAELDALYQGGAPEQEKLGSREGIFRQGEAHLKELGFDLGGPLNNAVILAHRLYHENLDQFRAAYEFEGREWPKTINLFRSLDRKNPEDDLRRRLTASSAVR